MPDSLTNSTVRGVAWSYSAVLAMAALQLTVTAVLARLVAPAAFGLLAMATLVLRFGQYFAQFGLGQALVQAAELDDASISASFWMSFLLGAVATAVVVLSAPLASDFFHAGSLAPVMRWMSVAFLFSGMSVTSLALLRRGLRYRAIAIVDLVSYTVGYAGIGIASALLGAQVWSLVLASLSQSVLGAIGYYSVTRHSLIPRRLRAGLGKIAVFGSQASLLGFLEFVASNLDTIAVGRFLGDTQLGFYSRGMSLAGLPMQQLSTGASRVLVSSFARVQRDLERVRRGHEKVTLVYGAIALPVAAGMMAASSTVVQVLLGPRWEPAVAVLRISLVSAPLTALTHLTEVVLESLARLRLKLALRAGQVSLFVILLSLLWRFGLRGFAVAFAASEAAMWLAYVLVAVYVLEEGWSAVGTAYTPGIVAALAVGVFVAVAEGTLSRMGILPAVRLGVDALGSAALLLGFILKWRRGRVWHAVRSVLPTESEGRMTAVLTALDRLSGGRVA